MGDSVAVLIAGAIAQVGNPDTIYNRPVSPAVARFLNCYNYFAGCSSGERFTTPHGRFSLAGAHAASASGSDAGLCGPL